MADSGFTFDLSPSTDVVAYEVTLKDSTGAVVGQPKQYPADTVVDPDDPTKGKIDIAHDPDFPNLDGTYTVEVRAVDDAGNTSDPLGGSLTLDVVRPDPPTNFEPF